MSYYTSRNYYTRPYKIPAHTGSVPIPDPYALWNNDVSEGCLTEYIAYREELPVTRSIVGMFLDDMELDEKLEDTKSLGNVVFSCTDGIYDTGYDLGTLARHFHLLNDMLSENVLPEKEVSGGYTLPLPYTIQEVHYVMLGLSWTPSEPHVRIGKCYRCLQFLRPRDTAYYMRYNWEIGENGLRVDEGELTLKETREFMLEVSHGLDDVTRVYLSKYCRITGSFVIGPLVSHILRDATQCVTNEQARLLSILLVEKPSVYLALLCNTSLAVDNNLVLDALGKIQLNDNAEGLDDEDWRGIQKCLFRGLQFVVNLGRWQTYLRVVAVLGWGQWFPAPEKQFICPKMEMYRLHYAFPLNTYEWMDNEMKKYVETANYALSS